MTGTMLGIYIALTVFALAIIVAESMGLLGDDDGGDGGDDAAGDTGDGGGDDAGTGDHGHAVRIDGLTSDGTAGEGADGTTTGGGQYARTARSGRGVFRALFLMRMLTYFAAGFGPMGLIAILYGESVAASLVWAVPAGLVVMCCAWAVLRFQRREFDSLVRDDELLGKHGEVTIAIHPGETGRVRIALGQMTADRYAVTRAEKIVAKGESVRITGRRGNDLVVAPVDEKETE